MLPLWLLVLQYSAPKLFSSGVLFLGAVFSSSHSVAEDTSADFLYLASSTALSHPKQVPAFSVHTSEQAVHVSPQNAVCPAPWTHKEERKYRKHKLWKTQTPLPTHAPFMWTSSPPGHPGPSDSREPWKAPQFSCSSFKTTKLSNKGTVVFVNSRFQQQWEGLICNPRYHRAPPRVPSLVAFCRQDTTQRMRREHRSPAWQEGNWLPIPLSARQNFFAAIHTFQWAGYKQPPDGFGGKWGQWH